MSNLSGLPPASTVRAASLAVTQDIAVRLIRLPDTINDNPQPLRLTGTVKGVSAEGAVRVETDRGVIEILLKDKGSLPVGQKLEIEIPAGRPPVNAAIRPPAGTGAIPVSPTAPPLASYIDPSRAPPIRLDRGQNLKAGDLAEALTAAGDGEEIRFSAPLQAGQILRLIPISSLPQTLGTIQNAVPFTPEELFVNLMSFIDQSIDLPIEIKKTLLLALSRIDPSSLAQPLPEDSSLTSQKQIQTALQKLAQVADLPEIPEFQNVASQKTAPAVFNPARPLDVQILAFQKTTFQTTLNQIVQTAISPAPTPLSAPLLTTENFVVLPPLSAPPLKPESVLQVPITPLPPAPSSAVPPPVGPPVETNQSPVSPPAQSPPPPASQPSVQIQTPPVPTAAAPVSPPVLLGQVTGMTQGGQPVIALALPNVAQPQLYVAQFQANNISAGAPVLVSPLQVSLPAILPAQQSANLVPFAIGGTQNLTDWVQPDLWEPLQGLMAAVGQTDPAALQSAIRMLPTPSLPQNMAPLSLFILSVMRTGDMDTWIGEPVLEALKQGGKLDLLRAAAGETTMFQRLENAPLPNEWKATMLPFWHGGQINKLPLYFKKWNDDNSAEETDRRNKLRFMFELKLSRMGAVQVDGFLQQKKLDMILRTKAAISTSMQEALRKTYYKAMENSNLSGEITFQFKPEQWVSIDMKETSSA